MDELASAAATIKGAHIQAGYAFFAALISSIIGALGLIFAARFAFKSGLESQIKNHLLEARREVYLDFIVKSNALILSGSLIYVRPETFYNELHSIESDFEASIHKVLLIAETRHQDEIYQFFDLCNSIFSSYVTAVNNYRNIESTKEDKVKSEVKNRCDLLLDLKGDLMKVCVLLRSELGISTNLNLETKLSNDFFKNKR